MNLIIDLGNTRLKLALFEGDKLLKIHKLDESELDDFIQELDLDKVERVIVSSVIASDSPVEEKLNALGLKLYRVRPLLESYPFKSKYSTPDTLGEDRICNAIAAAHMFPGKNVLSIDLGTCNKYDMLDANGVYQGGSISPGFEMSLKAMHEHTGRLPMLETERPEEWLGTSTEKAMLTGAYFGIIGEINYFIEQYGEKFSDLRVLLTGGFSLYFEKALKNHIFADPNLTLRGMNELLKSLEDK